MGFNKLVRDKIPEIIKANGENPVYRKLGSDEYKRELLIKLVEESQELLESNGDLTERADVAEVLVALDGVFGWSNQQVEEARLAKLPERGGFEGRIFLEEAS